MTGLRLQKRGCFCVKDPSTQQTLWGRVSVRPRQKEGKHKYKPSPFTTNPHYKSSFQNYVGCWKQWHIGGSPAIFCPQEWYQWISTINKLSKEECLPVYLALMWRRNGWSQIQTGRDTRGKLWWFGTHVQNVKYVYFQPTYYSSKYLSCRKLEMGTELRGPGESFQLCLWKQQGNSKTHPGTGIQCGC